MTLHNLLENHKKHFMMYFYMLIISLVCKTLNCITVIVAVDVEVQMLNV